MLLARFAFQACSFNHSDISPKILAEYVQAEARPQVGVAPPRPFPFHANPASWLNVVEVRQTQN